MVANQIKPPGFPPVQNNQNNFNRGKNFTQNRGGNFNQSTFNQSQLHRPQDLKGITTRSGVAYKGPTIPILSKVVKQGTEATKDLVQTTSPQSTAHVQPPVTQSETPVSEPIVAPVSAPMPNLKPSIPYPSRHDDERRHELANEQIENFYEIFKDMSFEISFTDALILMPKFASTLKALIGNKEKLSTEATKDPVQTTSPQSTAHVQPLVTQSETPVSKPIVAPVSAPMPNLKPSIPYPSRHHDERRHEQTNEQIKKFYEIFKDMSFEISFTDALILMPKFASTLKALIGNKEKLSEMARTSMNEHCSVVILNKLPKKLGDPGKFLIPCEFPGMDKCLALANLGASINLMPLFVWKELLLPELTPTCMTLE
nr:reverse transcriptase domain-containing protein [Tanacetum cinerariifolium]